MANNPQEFIPSFSSKNTEKHDKNTLDVLPQSSCFFVEIFGPSNPQSEAEPTMKKRESHQREKPDEVDIITEQNNIKTEDQFDQILSRVTEASSPSLEPPFSAPTQQANIDNLLETEAELRLPDLSHEDREEIYAEGFIAGSMEQKEIMDKRIEELKQTVLALGQHDNIADNLSQQINESIGTFTKSLVETIIGETKQNLLSEMVDSKTQEFVNSVRSWDCQIHVYCSLNDFNNLAEINNLSCTESSIKTHQYVYIVDKDLTSGKFRLEVNKKDETTIEASMDINSHLEAVRENVNELI